MRSGQDPCRRTLRGPGAGRGDPAGCAPAGPGHPVVDPHDRDPGQSERERPESLEGQVEEGQQDHLEDAVVADEQRPGRAAGRWRIAGGRCPGRGGRRAGGGQPPEDRRQGRPHPAIDDEQLLRAGGRRFGRRPAPALELGPVAGLDILAVESLPGALADLEQARLGPQLRRRVAVGPAQGARGGLGGARRPAERGMGDLDRARGRDGNLGRPVRPGEALPGQLGLALTERAERRVEAALESALGDRVGLAVAKQDQGRVEACRNERLAQRSVPSRISHRSRTASSAGSHRPRPAARRRRGPGSSGRRPAGPTGQGASR